MDCILKIDPEFENVIPPISSEEFEQLEENIVSEGMLLSPIVIWNDYIVDGHNRYKILRKHPEIECKTFEKHFEDRFEAIAWICRNQIGTRNLSERYMKYLRGKQYDAELKSIKFFGNQYVNADGTKIHSQEESGLGYNNPDQKTHGTRTWLAQREGIPESQIRYAQQFSRGLDAAEAALPGIKNEILNSEICPTDKAIAAIARLPIEKRKEAAENLRNTTDKRKLPHNKDKSPTVTRITPDTEADQIPPVNEDDILNTMGAAVNNLIDMCNNYFTRFPKLLSDDNYRKKTIATLNEVQIYLSKIERN